MNKTRTSIIAVAATAGLLATASAQAEFGIGLNVGTNGFGVEAKQSLSPSFDLRFGISGIRYSLDYEYDDVEYDVEQNLAIPAVMLDWRPMQGVFRMTLGAAYFNEVQNVRATPEPGYTYVIGNTSYSPSQIGTLNGKVEWHTGAPYLGFGWDFMHGKKKGLGFSVELGAYYRGEPDVSLTSTGIVTQADLNAEIQDIEKDAYSFVPTVQLGMTFKF